MKQLIALSDSFAFARRDVPDVLFERGLEIAHELDFESGLADLYTARYIYFMNTGEIEKGLVDVKKAIKHARIIDDQSLLRFSQLNHIDLLMIGGYTEESAELGTSLAKEFRASGDLIGESGAYRSLATLSSGLGNRELAAVYDSTSIALARRSGKDWLLSRAIFNAAANKALLGIPEEALPLAEEAMALAKKLGSEFGVENARSVRAEANTSLGNYAEALADYELLRVGEGEVKLTWRMTNKGALLQRIGRHEESRALLLEAVDIIKTTSNDPLELKRTYQALQTVDLNQTQYDSVVWYGKLMAAQQDSLQTAKNIKNLLELEEKYKAEEKEAEILLQQEQLALQRSQLYATVFGLLMALVAGIGFFLLSQKLRKRNAENEQLVTDKETLIGEIHHRVKNNLQVISSLLQLQRRGLESNDDKGRAALLESQNRVSAMGLIHNKLYQGEEVTSVHMPNYLEDLGETLLDAYRLEEQVEIFFDVEDLKLDVDNAIPLGLIINELVTNSLKYAFPQGREGTIEITLHREDGRLRLVVADDGVGEVAAEKRADSTSFGGNLIGLLTKKLKGSLRLLEGRGYGVEILFTE